MTNGHQKNIIKRYYEHHDTIQSNKLSELVSELWLAEGAAATKLWGQAQIALMRLNVAGAVAAAIVNKRDVTALAELVQKLDAKGAPPRSAPASPPSQESPATPVAGFRGQSSAQEQPIAPGAQSVSDGRTISQMKADLAAESGRDSLDEPNLKRALKAFRKKLKLMRLEDESRLGNRYTTSGRTSNITAITPPHDYPPAVWQKLVELGRLKNAGQGTYQLPG